MRREDGEHVLRVKLRGQGGRVVKTMIVRMKAPRLGATGKREVARELQDAIARVLRDGDRGDRDDRDDRGDRDDRDGRDDRDDRDARDDRDDRDDRGRRRHRR